MKAETFLSRNDLLPSQRKPLSSSLVKAYTNRPSSAMRTKYDTSQSNLSPTRKDNKKPSPTKFNTMTFGSTRALDLRMNSLRRSNEANASTSLSKSSAFLGKSSTFEENNNGKNSSTLNLKGFTVTPNSTTTLLQKSSVMNTSPYSSKSPLYNSVSSLTNRGFSPPRKITSQSKERTNKTSDSNLSLITLSSKDRHFNSDLSYRDDKTSPITYTPTKLPKGFQYEEEVNLPAFEPTKCSVKQNGVIKAYAVNTHQGIVRSYNEDRVSIILNIMKPAHLSEKHEWPLCSFFGVYDGHGGTNCADFLRDNLHQYVIQDKNFPKNPIEALKRGFEEAEKAFKELAQHSSKIEIDRSGSCAVVALVVEDMCYIANVGDSRVVASFEQGKRAIALSRDHKPNDKDESRRIVSSGGKIYQSQITTPPGYPGPKVILGPHRVFPGRLSVSRTFGDIEAKIPKYGGNPYVVIAEPEIKAYKVTKEWDYIILASDGIYDKLESREVVNCIWNSTRVKESDVHKQSAMSVEKLMKESLIQKTMDNITVVMVSFSGFEKAHVGSESSVHFETKKVDLDASSQSLHKSFISNSGYKYSDKNQNSSTPLGSRSFILGSADRQPSFTTTKRVDNLTSPSLDTSGLYKSYRRANTYDTKNTF